MLGLKALKRLEPNLTPAKRRTIFWELHSNLSV
jgi:hypothetical protein